MKAGRVPPPEILLPKDKFLLIDLDGTLINKAYEITDPDIEKEIGRVQSLGWTIIIHLGSVTDTTPRVFLKFDF